jgi:sugar phosphate isomerase/epimerase
MDIGVRTPPCAGQMGFAAFAKWCAEEGFAAIDVGKVDAEIKSILDGEGLRLGTVDLPQSNTLCNPDAAARAAGLEVHKRELEAAAALGAKVAFTVLMPPDANQPRRVSFDFLKDSLPKLAELLESLDMSLAIEGWPGGGPQYPSLGCTPETLRAIFAAAPSSALGICFDPSHLVRLGIDHERFLVEFGSRVKHCHGKDTELIEEDRYLCGNLDSTFGGRYVCGDRAWRYTIPGEGEVDWLYVMNRLDDAKYGGLMCVELEDHHYWQTVELQQLGLTRALSVLEEYAGRV